MSQTTAELLHAINDQVKEYAGVTGAGKKAGIARKISSLEMDLVLAGAIPGTPDDVKDKKHPATFTPWTNPTAARSTRTPITEAELRADIAAAYSVLTGNMPGLDTPYPESIRAGADTRIGELLRKSEVRGYQIPDPRKKNAPAPAETPAPVAAAA